MAQAQDAVWLPVLPSMKGFGPALVKGAGSEADKAGKGVGAKLGTAIVGGVAAAGAGIAAAGAALYKVGAVFDDVSDTIRAGTGKTGKDLDGLVDVAKKVGSTVPAEFEAIGKTVADVSTRMGLTGATLEKVSSQYLEAGRVLGEEVDVAKTSAAFNAFGIEGDNVSGAMDHLFQVAQATGVSMNELAANASRSAPAMKALGFSFEETTAMAGSFDKAGLNSGAIMASMSKGLVTLAKDGEEPQEAFKRTVGEIEGFIKAGDTAGALNLASKVFGTKGATQFIGALQSGALNLDDLGKAAGQTGDTILGVGQDTADFAEQWMLFKNRVLVWLEPLGSKVFGALGTAMGEVNGAVLAFGAAWKANDGDITSSGLPGFFERLAFLAHRVWDQLKVSAGPVLASIGAAVRPLLPVFAALLPQVISFVASFSPLGLLFKVLGPVLPQIVGMFAQLAHTLAGVLGTVLPLVTALVGALVPVIVNLVSSVLPPVIDAFMSIVGAVSPLVSVILAALIPAIQFLMPIVKVAFALIAGAIKIAIGIITGTITGLIGFLRDGLAPVFIWLFVNVIKPAWDGIQAAVKAVVDWFTTTALPVIQTVIGAVGAVFSWLYNNVVKPVFGFISGAVNAAWLVISFIFQALVAVVQKVLGPVFTWLWLSVIKPVFQFIGSAISAWWNLVVLPVFNAVWGFLKNTLGPVFDWLWKNAIKPAFDGIGSAIKTVWEKIIKPVFDTLSTFITKTIPKAFEDGVKFIKTHWDKIQAIAKAPVKFVVETVINKGLIGGLNGIAGFLGIKPLPTIDLGPGWRDGGYTGNLPRNAIAGAVHGDEHVIKSPSRRKFERRHPGVLDYINRFGEMPGYRDGGRVKPLRDLMVTQGYNRVHKGIDYAAQIGTPVFATQDGVVSHAGPGARAPGVWGGNEVHILGNGIETWFAHLSRIGVRLGQRVRAGQQIADSGNTGISSGPHLHFGVFNGGWPNDIDPNAYLGGAGVPSGKPWNPIADIVGGLVSKFKDAFPAAGIIADIAIGAGKKLLDGAVSFVTGQSNDGAAAGVPYLHDQGGVLNPGLSSVLNATRKPEYILNSRQWNDLHSLATRPGTSGGGDVIVQGNVGWMPDQLAREIEVQKRRTATMAGMSGVVFA
ncbi:tail length tape measure protein [Arthrobacter phage Sarge]|uniref:Tape measure protein n=1 Tax=Arthrobacter phage Sarge TaxID=2885974 RepID=A0AAE8Y6K2_9CAUD|nr:tail length tape measure protein [Arthrobacter phage Sarge]UDL14863.1 tape measure protein [Arthrobacter phage Sarge]